mgnify:CR=1 FL=1
MKRKIALFAMAVLVGMLAAAPALAQPDRQSVGLGVSIGAAWPEGKSSEIQYDDWSTSFNWGFYVNIPLLWTFHLTPSAELYRFGDINATDISLAFKFIVPAWKLDLFVGVVPGLTTIGDDTLFNIGGLGGVSFNLFSNIDAFVQVKYKIIIQEDENKRVLHANAGLLFRF